MNQAWRSLLSLMFFGEIMVQFFCLAAFRLRQETSGILSQSALRQRINVISQEYYVLNCVKTVVFFANCNNFNNYSYFTKTLGEVKWEGLEMSHLHHFSTQKCYYSDPQKHLLAVGCQKKNGIYITSFVTNKRSCA